MRKKHYASINSSLTHRPMRRWFPLFLLPTFLCFLIGFVWPFIQGIYLSFCDFNIPKDAEWVGKDLFEEAMQNPDFAGNIFEQIRYAISISFKNYQKAFADPSFSRAFWNTASFAVVSIVAINVFAFAIAYFLTKKMKGANIFRTVFFMPNLIGGLVLGYIWSMIFDGALQALAKPALVSNSVYGFWGLVILVAWQQIGYMMIIYIAGLQSVPEDMLEAAKIDGASSSQSLFKVIIPNVMPSITICTFLTLTNSFKLFDQNMALTGGSPIETLPDGSQIKTTEMLALNIFNTYNINRRWHGTAQAKAVIFFILVAVLALAQQYFTRKKEVQQ